MAELEGPRPHIEVIFPKTLTVQELVRDLEKARRELRAVTRDRGHMLVRYRRIEDELVRRIRVHRRQKKEIKALLLAAGVRVPRGSPLSRLLRLDNVE